MNSLPSRASAAARLRLGCGLAVLLLGFVPIRTGAQPAPAADQIPPVLVIPPAAQVSAHFNAKVATEAYLAEIPASARTRSDAYFEGGYWLILWDFLAGAVISLLLLHLRWSAAMRDLAERITRFKPLQSAIYWAQYLVVTTALGFPIAAYEGFFREHRYGLATQTFGPWAFDQVKQLLVGLVVGGVIIVVLFGVVRRLPRTWWIWGAVVSMALFAFGLMIAPVYLTPIFNRVTRLDDPRIAGPILSLARANGIPAQDVYVIDASRQTTRISANVSGLGRTLRITLNDNLLRRGPPEEIQAVMAHEMGHYVLNHTYTILMFYLIVTVAGFSWLRWALDRCLRRWGEPWRIRGVGDVAVVPLVVVLLTAFFFVLTPLTNTFSRTLETEADIFGLNASRQPDGFAQAAIQAAEYRKMSPGPLEEWLFYDHPSGHTRIYSAMRWKAEHLGPATPPPETGTAK
ncbi:MAG: M48 family metalloprotease [Opitutaceae bacterium]